MAGSGDVGTRSRDTDWVTPFAQERVDDEVLVAAIFGPNAPGRSAFSSLDAFGQRQKLKAEGRHHGERLVLALTALQIHALSLSIRGRVVEHLTWDRARVRVVEVPVRPGVTAPGPALFIGSSIGHQAIEVVERGDAAIGPTLLAGLRPPSVSRP